MIHKDGADAGARQQVVHVVVGPRQIRHFGLQFGVDRGQSSSLTDCNSSLEVSSSSLVDCNSSLTDCISSFAGFELLVGSLQFLVGGLDVFFSLARNSCLSADD